MSDGTFRGRWIDEVFRAPSISDAVRVALLALAMEMNEAGEVSTPRPELAHRLSRSERRVAGRLSDAIDAGYLARTGRGQKGRTASYRGVIPGHLRGTPGGHADEVQGVTLQHPERPAQGVTLQHPEEPEGDTRGSRFDSFRGTPGGHATYKARTDLSDHGDGAIVVRLFDDEENSKPSLRSQTGVSAPARGEHPAFAEWYAAFPVHKARGAAIKAFTKAAKKADPETLIAAAKRYRDDAQVQRGYAKHPATWLNQECWLDEPADTAQTPAPYQPAHDLSGTDARVAGWAALAAELDRNQP